ncbi:extracellular solute-binding protein, family 1 [Roseobacter sp. GAI101]|nr:extracellular solute-binding protein, family 1 [Roseobacter sp. GAI101]
MTLKKSALAAVLMASAALPAFAEGQLNIYSSRHYDTDEKLYSDFTDQTGITINRIEGKADELLARMKAEGANSPADILVTVDTSRLSRAQNMACCIRGQRHLEERIPANCKTAKTNGSGSPSGRGSFLRQGHRRHAADDLS